jgi:gas vesicle structural protein
MGIRPEEGKGLFDAVERILDKGVVINADISVSVVGTELLGIKIRAAIASFETAALYGLEFPSGTDFSAEGWKHIDNMKRVNIGKGEDSSMVIEEDCPVCGHKKKKTAYLRQGDQI